MRFGTSSSAAMPSGFTGTFATPTTSPDTVIQLGYPPNRIDLLTEPSGVTFEECWSRRERVQLTDELTINVIGFGDLIANKRATGRPQDVADLLRLTRDTSTSEHPTTPSASE